MKLHLIVAMTCERVIGVQNRLPWNIPVDKKHFMDLTKGNIVVMGRKTYESIGLPLADRTNIVVSSTLETKKVIVCDTVQQALQKANTYGKDVYIIGGAKLYEQALPIVDTLIISWVHAFYKGDVYFPAFSLQDWKRVEKTQHQEVTICKYVKALHT